MTTNSLILLSSRDEVHFLALESGLVCGCWSVGERGTMQFQIYSLRGLVASALVSWIPEPPCKKLNHPEVTMLWRTWRIGLRVERKAKEHRSATHVSEETILQVDHPIPAAPAEPADNMWVRDGTTQLSCFGIPHVLYQITAEQEGCFGSLSFGVMCYPAIGNQSKAASFKD